MTIQFLQAHYFDICNDLGYVFSEDEAILMDTIVDEWADKVGEELRSKLEQSIPRFKFTVENRIS